MFFLTPWVTRLLIANGVAFVVTAVLPRLYGQLAFVPAAVLVRPWTPVTYMFLHAGFGHLFVNMLGLFFFGPRLEDRLGGRSFLVLYFLSGLGGALFSFVFNPVAAVVGASGAVFGVLLGFAYYWPDDQIFLMGILPMPAWVFVVGLVAISLYSGISGAQGSVAHFAHLGGLALAFGYLRWREWKKRRKRRRVEKPNSAFRAPGVRDREKLARWKAIPLEKLHEVNREEVERLLERVDDEGIKGLSSDERSFLERMARAADPSA